MGMSDFDPLNQTAGQFQTSAVPPPVTPPPGPVAPPVVTGDAFNRAPALQTPASAVPPPPAGPTSALDQLRLSGVPIGGTPGQTSVTKNQNVSTSRATATPEYIKAQKEREIADAKAAEALHTEGQVAVQGARDAYLETQMQATELSELANAQAKRLAKYQEENKARQAEVEKKNKEYETAAKNLDPDRIMSGWNRVVAGIAIGLGGFAAGLRGDGRNSANAIIDAAIERDYKAQQDKVAAKLQGSTLAQKALQDARSIYDSEEAAHLQFQATMGNLAAMEMKRQGMLAQGAEKKAAFDTAAEERLAKAKADSEKAAGITGILRTEAQTGTQTTVTSGKEATAADYLDALSKSAELEAKDPNAPTTQQKERQGKFEDKLEGAATFNERLKQAEKLLNDVAFKGLAPTDQKRKLQALIQLGSADYVRSKSGAQANESERKNAEDTIRGRSWTSEGAQDEIRFLRDDMAKALHQSLVSMHPTLRARSWAQMQSAGYDPQFLETVATGKSPALKETGQGLNKAPVTQHSPRYGEMGKGSDSGAR